MNDLGAVRPSSWSVFKEAMRIASEEVFSNRLRSGLTVLGVGVGVSVILTLAALMTGLQDSVLTSFETGGPRNFYVMRFDFSEVVGEDSGDQRPPWWNNPEIRPSEAAELGRLPSVHSASFQMSFSVDVSYGGTTVRSVEAEGYTADWPTYSSGEFVAGRNFSLGEVEQNRPGIVISPVLAERLFGEADPIGRRIQLASTFRGTQESFVVLGVYQMAANIFSDDADESWAAIPWTSAVRRLRQSAWRSEIRIVPTEAVSVDRAKDDVISTMRRIRGLGPREENNFAVMSSDQILTLFNQITGVFFLVMLALSSVALLVGGVGVIGIMMISVTERTREIGVRKSLGAAPGVVLLQFLAEAVFLTLAGASVGVLIGLGFAELAATYSPIPASMPPWAMGVALGAAAVTGVLFGLLPAHRASRLDPAVAVRAE